MNEGPEGGRSRAIRQSIAIHLRIEADKTKREEKGADADDARKFLVA